VNNVLPKPTTTNNPNNPGANKSAFFMSKSNLNNTSNTNSSYGTVNPNANGNTNTDNNQAQVNQATNSTYGQGNSQASVIDSPQTSASGNGINWLTTPAAETLADVGASSSANVNQFSFWNNSLTQTNNSQNNNALENMHTAAGMFGIGAGIEKYTTVVDSTFTGVMQDIGFQGLKVPTEVAAATTELFSDALDVGAKVTGIGDTLIGATQGGFAFFEGQNTQAGKDFLDAGMGLVGLVGGKYGLIASGTYFAIDQTIGWNNAISSLEKGAELQEQYTELVNNPLARSTPF